MKLIDADKLKKDDEITLWLSNNAIRTGKTLKMFSELFIKKIDEQPLVQVVPIDVLDKIKAEIHTTAEMHEDGDYYLRDEWIDEIIDKYKAKGSDNEVLDKIRAETTYPFVTYIIPTGTEKPLKVVFEGDDHIDAYIKEGEDKE